MKPLWGEDMKAKEVERKSLIMMISKDYKLGKGDLRKLKRARKPNIF